LNYLNDEPKSLCALCERQVNRVSRHHLVPKQAGGKHGETVALCQPCHTTIHLTFSNKELAVEYNTLRKLQQAPKLSKYLNWIRKRKIEKIANRRRK
jgi:5-methylcytosine-specific restriction protein A